MNQQKTVKGHAGNGLKTDIPTTAYKYGLTVTNGKTASGTAQFMTTLKPLNN